MRKKLGGLSKDAFNPVERHKGVVVDVQANAHTLPVWFQLFMRVPKEVPRAVCRVRPGPHWVVT